MEFGRISKIYSLKKSTYVNLRWIGILGQLVTINFVKFVLGFDFNFLIANFIVIIGIISNLGLINFYKKSQLSNRSAFNFLFLDIIQLSSLLFLTGGVLNPFSIFLLIPSVFAASSLEIKTNLLLILITLFSILFLTFYAFQLPSPLNELNISNYYFYAIPLSLIIALIFLNYFALTFGKESNLRKEALDKIKDEISKEHELVSLGGQAAAAAHSLGTPLSTIKIITQDLYEQFKNKKEVNKDIELLVSQVERCNQILKKLTLNPSVDDDFLDKDFGLYEYLKEIVNSFQAISNKNFDIDIEQNSNPFHIRKSIEIMYGLRNFIGNANKFSKKNIYISLRSDSEISQVIIEDDGLGFPKDIIDKIGEPYIKSFSVKSNKSGLGLGLFIGKTLLEKNSAKLMFRNSVTRGGAEVKIEWFNKDLIDV